MTMVSKVIAHPDRKKIERNIVAGIPLSTIAREYGISTDSLAYHRDNHLGAALVGATNRSLKIHGDSLLQDMLSLMDTTKQILDSALSDNARGLSLKCIKEARCNVETLGKILFAMNQQEGVQLSPKEIEIQRRDQEQNEQIQQFIENHFTDAEREIYYDLSMKAFSGNEGFVIEGIDPNYKPSPQKKATAPYLEKEPTVPKSRRTTIPANQYPDNGIKDAEIVEDLEEIEPKMRVKRILPDTLPGTEHARPGRRR